MAPKSRQEQAEQRDDRSHSHIAQLQILLHQVDDGCNADAAPDSVGIERAGISIVALTRLVGRLVQIDHDGESRHEEEEEYHPELAYAATSAPGLPEQADDAEQEGQTIEDVVALIVLQLVGQLALIAQSGVVEPFDAADPVAMFHFAITLDIVLTAYEVPHEVAPVHPVALIADEEFQVLPSRRDRYGLSGMEDAGYLTSRDAAYPSRIERGMLGRVHTREEHVLFILHLAVVARNIVGVLLVGIALLGSVIDRCSIGEFRCSISVGVHFTHLVLRGVGLSVEQRTIAILVTAQIAA